MIVNNTPRFVNRKTVNSSNTFESMPAERIIQYVQSVYPNAKLIPNSNTYNKAVAEYNIVVRMGMERPPIPKWFCGSVNNETGELGLTVATIPVSDKIQKIEDLTSSFLPSTPSAYAWDDCLLIDGDENRGRACSPGTPDYVLCYTSGLSSAMASSIDSTFWDDFTIEYDEEARAAAMEAMGESLGEGGEGEEEEEEEGGSDRETAHLHGHQYNSLYSNRRVPGNPHQYYK